MYQIVQRLGLRPRPHWGSSQLAPPDPLAGKGGGGNEGKDRRGEKREEEGGGGGGGKGRGRLTPLN